MRTLIARTLTLVLVALTARTAWSQGTAAPSKRTNPPAISKPATKPPAPFDPNAEKARVELEAKARQEMDHVLEEWEQKSKKIVSLDVSFDRIDKSPGWGDQYFRGRAMLQSPDLACLEFQKYKLGPNGKPLFGADKLGNPVPQTESQPTERIICTGTDVLQYSYEERKIYIFPLDKQSRQKALQQGPLPFLFNMKAAEAKSRYSMNLIKQDDKDYLIGILPRETVDKQSFSKAFLWLNKETFLPNQLWLYTVGDKERQEFQFVGGSNTIVPNAAMDKKWFAFAKIEGWKEIRNPAVGAEPGPAAQGLAQPVRRAAIQPGKRPSPDPR